MPLAADAVPAGRILRGFKTTSESRIFYISDLWKTDMKSSIHPTGALKKKNACHAVKY